MYDGCKFFSRYRTPIWAYVYHFEYTTGNFQGDPHSNKNKKVNNTARREDYY